MQNNDNKQIVSAIIIAGVLIAGAILLKGSSPKQTTTNEQKAETVELRNMDIRPVTKEDHILGNIDAKIVIVEYSDTECPFCKVFHNTMHSLIKDRSDVAWVYRHYPIPQLHPKASLQAEATECAWEQGGNEMFWKYTDKVYETTTSNNGLKDEQLYSIAESLGLNSSSFYTCVESGKYKAKVQADIADGTKNGVNGTPASFVITKNDITESIQKEMLEKVNAPGAYSFSSSKKNIMSLNGALPLDMVTAIVDVLLK